MVEPLTTPCAHNFCKACLEGVFAGQSLVKERAHGGRTLRTQKNIMKCPSCKNDLSDFLQNPQVTNIITLHFRKINNSQMVYRSVNELVCAGQQGVDECH